MPSLFRVVVDRAVKLRRRAALAGLATVLLFAGFGCRGANKEVIQRSQPITLKYWRVFDGDEAFGLIFNDYRKIHPNIAIEYRRFRFDEYEKALLDAIAEDKGPDI